MSQITFPEDLNGDFYPECIRFGIYQRDGVGLDVVKNKLNKAKEQIDGIANQTAGTTIADSIGNGSSGSFDATKATQQNQESSTA